MKEVKVKSEPETKPVDVEALKEEIKKKYQKKLGSLLDVTS